MLKYLQKLIKSFNRNQRGNLLLFAMIFGSISFTVIVLGVSGYAMYENKASIYKHNREYAFQIAEAGINYYRWHLAHDNEDYWDGQGQGAIGPFVHEYKDKNDQIIGYFSLGITPPALGSTVVTISSTGWVLNQSKSKRTIKARVGFESLADYAFLTNNDVWIGASEVTSGKFHANGGIRFDGIGNAPITSAKDEYVCMPMHGQGCTGQLKPGIWGSGGPQDYWDFPVPAIDFDAITANLADVRAGALNGGIYKPSSGEIGWHINFTADGDVRIRKVLSCESHRGKDIGSRSWKWFCIDINSEEENWETLSMPSNGYIYIEDDVWVDGDVNGRVTIGAKSDSGNKSIIINNNIQYIEKNGEHILGLIASDNVLIPYNSPDILRIDGAILAQNGAAKRYYFPGNIKDELFVYGSIITNGVWTWSWVTQGGSVVSGYRDTYSTYDANLTYGPPPGFPIGSEYNLISWEEVEY